MKIKMELFSNRIESRKREMKKKNKNKTNNSSDCAVIGFFRGINKIPWNP